VQINDALVDAHFETIPGVGTFSRRGLARGDLQALRGHADGAGHVQALVGGALLQIGTDLLQVGHVAGR